MSADEQTERLRTHRTDTTTADDKQDIKLWKWRINKSLLPLKVFYFFFYGACGSVIPFITVYLKHLRLTALETGIITGVSVFLAFFVRTIIGMLADRLSASKSALIVCCFGFGTSFFFMWFLPARVLQTAMLKPSNISTMHQAHLHHPSNLSFHEHWVCRNDLGRDLCSYPSLDPSRACVLIGNALISNTLQADSVSEFDSKPRNSVEVQDSGGLDHGGVDHSETNSELFNNELSSENAHDTQNDRRDKRRGGPAKRSLDSTVPCFQVKQHAYMDHHQRNGEISHEKGTIFGKITKRDDPRLPQNTVTPKLESRIRTTECLTNCRLETMPHGHNGSVTNSMEPGISRDTAAVEERFSFKPDVVFFVSFILISVARAFYSSSTSLADTVTYTLLGNNRLQWGKQRLWGTIGTAVAVITLTSINDALKGENFSGLFLTGLILAIMACVVAGFKLRADRVPKNSTFRQDMGQVLSSPFIRLFLVKLAFLGLMCGAAQNFFLWFMVDLGSTQTLLGLTVLTHCTSSVFVLRSTARVIRYLGQVRTMYLVLCAYVLRYLAFSFLPSAWWALPIELLHGVTYSMLWAAASSMTSLVAPPGTQATCQAITGAVYWDLGRGLGNVITGKLLDSLGARWTFRLYASACAVVLPIFFLLDRKWSLPVVEEKDKEHQQVVIPSPSEESPEEPKTLAFPEPFSLRPSSLPDGNISLSSIDVLSTSQTLSDHSDDMTSEPTSQPTSSYLTSQPASKTLSGHSDGITSAPTLQLTPDATPYPTTHPSSQLKSHTSENGQVYEVTDLQQKAMSWERLSVESTEKQRTSFVNETDKSASSDQVVVLSVHESDSDENNDIGYGTLAIEDTALERQHLLQDADLDKADNFQGDITRNYEVGILPSIPSSFEDRNDSLKDHSKDSDIVDSNYRPGFDNNDLKKKDADVFYESVHKILQVAIPPKEADIPNTTHHTHGHSSEATNGSIPNRNLTSENNFESDSERRKQLSRDSLRSKDSRGMYEHQRELSLSAAGVMQTDL